MPGAAVWDLGAGADHKQRTLQFRIYPGTKQPSRKPANLNANGRTKLWREQFRHHEWTNWFRPGHDNARLHANPGNDSAGHRQPHTRHGQPDSRNGGPCSGHYSGNNSNWTDAGNDTNTFDPANDSYFSKPGDDTDQPNSGQHARINLAGNHGAQQHTSRDNCSGHHESTQLDASDLAPEHHSWDNTST